MDSELYKDHEIEKIAGALEEIHDWLKEFRSLLQAVERAVERAEDDPDLILDTDWGDQALDLELYFRTIPRAQFETLKELREYWRI